MVGERISTITDYSKFDIGDLCNKWIGDLVDRTDYVDPICLISVSEPNYWYRVFHRSKIWRGRRVIGSLEGYNQIKSMRLFRNGG